MDGPIRMDETEAIISDLKDKIEFLQFKRVEKMERKKMNSASWTCGITTTTTTKKGRLRTFQFNKNTKPI